MPADAPWTKVYHEDFLQGCMLANLTADEVGVYTVVLMLMAARGGPIEFDSAWINSYARCSSQRKCTAIIERLIAISKLERRGRLLGNARMIRVVEERNAKSAQASRAALVRWHNHDGPELPLPAPATGRKTADKGSDKYPDKGSDKSKINGPINPPNPQKTADAAMRTHVPFARARAKEAQNLETNLPHPDSKTDVGRAAKPNGTGGSGPGAKPDRLADADLRRLYDAVSDASGHSPSSPAQIDRAMRFVENWRRDGIDFDQVVIPTIRAAISESHEPTRTLGRFDARVRHEHARLRGANATERRYTQPASPVLLRDGEDERLRPFRAALLEALGPQAYVRLANKVRLTVVEEHEVVRINDPRVPYLTDEHKALAVKCARACGFKGVW